MRLLGVDPGAVTGWAVVDVVSGGDFVLIASGEVDARGMRPWPEAADAIRNEIERIVREYNPAVVRVEIPQSRTFLATFLGTAAIAKVHEFVGIYSTFMNAGSAGALKVRARKVAKSEHIADAIAMCLREVPNG